MKQLCLLSFQLYNEVVDVTFGSSFKEISNISTIERNIRELIEISWNQLIEVLQAIFNGSLKHLHKCLCDMYPNKL